MWLTAAIFTITYAALAIGKVPGLRIDRAGIAFVGRDGDAGRRVALVRRSDERGVD